VEEFSLRDLAPLERAELLDDLAQHASVPFRAGSLVASRPVTFTHRTRRLRDIELTRTAFDNYLGERTPTQARDLSAPRLVIAISEGEVDIEQGDTQARGAYRSVVPFWSLSSWKVLVPTPSSFWALSIPLSDLGLPHLLLRDLMVKELGRTPLAPLLLRHVESIAALPALEPEIEAALANPTVEIVRALLTTAVGDEFRSREPVGRTLGLRIMAYLSVHATEPDLTAERVAAQFGISRRYLFSIMHELEVPMHEWIREQRLTRAAGMLTDPINARVSVATIGHLCGFADHSSFSRAFRIRFGCAPSEWSHQPSNQRVSSPA
jgi:AraC-like DNA-binding protein